MKIRLDYVTNSSSSSFVICAKVNLCDSLEKHMSEEYGKYGTTLLKEHLLTSDTVLNDIEADHEWIDDNYIGEDDAQEIKRLIEKDPDSCYLFATVYIEDTEGGVFPDDALWLYSHIPSEYKERIFETDPY